MMRILIVLALVFSSSVLRASTCGQQVVVIVDGYSSGALLPEAFRRRKIKLVHIHSRPDVNQFDLETFRPQDYDLRFTYTRESEDQLIQELEYLEPTAIIAGAESSVELADQISHRFGLINSNGTPLSSARRNKYEMHKRLAELGIRSIQQFKTIDWNKAKAWILERAQWPVVLKPPKSAGTDSVFFVNSVEEAKAAFEHIMSHLNAYGDPNPFVLLQEYIEGEEYMYNTVSALGQHRTSDIWRYSRSVLPGHATRTINDSLLPFRGEVQDQLRPYAYQVLDALGIKNGPAHLEIKMTKNGPVLIEVGARVCGAGVPKTAKKAIGTSQIEMTAEAYLDPEAFVARADGYELKKYAANVFVVSNGNGARLSLHRMDQLRAIPSISHIEFYFDEGQVLPNSIDAETVVGTIEILHEDPQVVQHTAGYIEALIDAGEFEKRSRWGLNLRSWMRSLTK